MKNNLLLLTLFISLTLSAQNISTIAGTGLNSYNGDGILATSANLNYPSGTIFDRDGNLLICDHNNNRIRKVDGAGVISTIAGNESFGYFGDNVAATSTPICGPKSMVFDSSGNLIFTDYFNCRIRKIDTNGIITTIAGNGECGDTGDTGLAILAKVSYPDFITIDDSDNLYFTEGNSHKVRKIDASGIITTFAGTGIAEYNGDGINSTTANINFPSGIAIDEQNNVYIAEYFGNRIRKINSLGIISTIAGTGISGYNGDNIQATTAQINNPMGLKFIQGNLYISDARNNRIRSINNSGIITTIVGTGVEGFSGDGGPALSAQLNYPVWIEFSNDGSMFISDDFNFRIRKVTNILSNVELSFSPNTISFSPNPTLNGKTTIFFPENTEEVEVFDMLGQSVLKAKTFGLDKLEMNFPTSGVYFVRVYRNGQYIVRRLLVK